MEQDYLIKKPPFQALFIFALPIIIGNLFQQTYTMADSAIVGRFVSEQALAAVGASYSLTNILSAWPLAEAWVHQSSSASISAHRNMTA